MGHTAESSFLFLILCHNDMSAPTQGSMQVSQAAASCSVVQQRHFQLQRDSAVNPKLLATRV